MINYNYFVNKNNLEVEKVTIKNNITILKTPLGLFVLKRCNNIEIFNYLLSKEFDNFPKIIDSYENIIMYKYLEEVEVKDEEKVYDFIKLLGKLHKKTSYYKELDNITLKMFFDELYKEINDLKTYYLNLVNIIESKEYMSPEEYLFIRNYTIINNSIDYSINKLNDYLKEDNNKKRVSTLLLNNDLNNMVKTSDKNIFLNFNNSKVGIPILDLVDFYKRYYKYDFYQLLKEYEKVFKLDSSELDLLFILLGIPDKIVINNKINSIKDIKNSIDKIYRFYDLLNSKEKESTSTKEQEDNK